MVVYAPQLRNQWQETGSHFSMATGRKLADRGPTTERPDPGMFARRRCGNGGESLRGTCGSSESLRTQLSAQSVVQRSRASWTDLSTDDRRKVLLNAYEKENGVCCHRATRRR